MKIKTKVNKCDLLKLKSFSTAKKTVKKKHLKRPPHAGKKIIVTDETYKGRVFKIYKQFMRFNLIKTNQYKNGQNT